MSEALPEIETREPPSVTGRPRGLATYGLLGGFRTFAWVSRVREKAATIGHDFDSPDGSLATFVLSSVVLTTGSYERRRVAEAMEPVRVRAKSDATAKVRTKIIMMTPADMVGTQEAKRCALFSVNYMHCRAPSVSRN